jgi:NADH-quinone oxidoreductase subunit C
MPDATGLELIAQELRDADAESVLDTVFFRDQAALLVAPAAVPATLQHLKGKG